jgi:damage-control phosphatase, subfamily I
MASSIHCIPCLVRQAVDLVRSVVPDETEQKRLLRFFLLELGTTDLDQPAPVIAKRFQTLIQPFMPEEDVFLEMKERFTRLALAVYPEARRRVRAAEDPLRAALALAAAGNVIDVGAYPSVDDSAIEAVLSALKAPFFGDVKDFRDTVERARKILYLADNTGEIVFDKLLLELLPRDRILLAVRGAPVLNDATLDDAEASGLLDLVEVIENGSNAPGTMLEDCSPEFRLAFDESDLIVAKGQGNYETLNTEDKEIFFLLKIKCEVVASQLRCPLGGLVLHHHLANQE